MSWTLISAFASQEIKNAENFILHYINRQSLPEETWADKQSVNEEVTSQSTETLKNWVQNERTKRNLLVIYVGSVFQQIMMLDVMILITMMISLLNKINVADDLIDLIIVKGMNLLI